MATADRISAVVFCALGLAMLVGGYTMDRLEIRQIHPLSIPGLLPMLLGGALSLCAVVLWVQAGRDDPDAGHEVLTGGSLSRLGLTTALTCLYALVLVGWVPFFWATTVFIAGFTAIFSWPTGSETASRAGVVLKSLVFGAIAAGAVTLLFQEAFLVRLP